MLCTKPFMAGTVPFGCGQCLPCRINKRRQWMWRQFFESLLHEENCFVTLTYSDSELPPNGNLVPKDAQLWLKRFRKIISPRKVRYFLVGEYGDETFRPHYHLSLFGVGGLTLLPVFGGFNSVAAIIESTWGKGISHTVEFNERTAQYVAGYTTKKLTTAGDPRLKGRTPEFMRSSRRPGLGVDAMKIVAQQLLATNNLSEDVPHSLKLGRKNIPLGRFMLKKLREFAGMSPDAIQKVKDAISYERSLEMHALFKTHGDSSVDPAFTSTKAHIKEVSQRVLNAEARYKLWDKKRGTL